MNVELLRKIKDKILEQPENFQMEDWHSECGTAHCIAGWAQVLTVGEQRRFGCDTDAVRALGLSNKRNWDLCGTNESERLFHETYWPKQFKEPCLTAGQYAKQAAKRIEFFIATNGTDREEEIPAFIVGHKESILDILTMRPSSKPTLRKINGAKRKPRATPIKPEPHPLELSNIDR